MNVLYDGIILGTGHNVLVLQAYLSRAGLRCLALDRAAAPGGGLTTVERPNAAGFLHNTHSFFHRAITDMPWFRDLELARHGVRYLEPELNAAVVLPDGRVLEWWTDLERTAASFAEFSRKDAAALRRWAAEFEPIVEHLIAPEARSPPLPPERRVDLLSRSRSGRRLLEVEPRSPLQFVLEEFEDDAVRAGLLFFNGLREVDLRLPGFGHAIPALLAARRKAQMCAGGSAALARGLVADIREHGGEIRCGVEIRSMLVERGRTAGVELAGGERIGAAFIASGLNPQQTFLELLPEGEVSSGVRRRAAGFRYNVLAPLFTLNLALAEPPRYAAATRRPELEQAFMVILGLDSPAQFEAMAAAHDGGRMPPTIAWGACPTRFDPAQAPPGRHTAFLWQKVPFRINGDAAAWKALAEEHARRLLEFWSGYAPNLGKAGVIIDDFHQSPPDTVTALPNMTGGDLLVGSFAGGQVGYNRPFAGAGGYRTPLPGLYLCGGSTHPGGNITGLCGYNAAGVIAADLGLAPWWNPVPVEEAWAAAP